MDHVARNAEAAMPARNRRRAGELLGAADEEPWTRDFGARRYGQATDKWAYMTCGTYSLLPLTERENEFIPYFQILQTEQKQKPSHPSQPNK